MQAWQAFHAANKYIGPDNVARIFNREKRSAYSWGQDPDYTKHRCKSPLEHLHSLFGKMDDAGIGYIARAAIHYLETAIDADIDADVDIVDTLPTITEEILADYTAVAALQQAIDTGADLCTVKVRATEAIGEIERTVAKYAKEHGK